MYKKTKEHIRKIEEAKRKRYEMMKKETGFSFSRKARSNFSKAQKKRFENPEERRRNSKRIKLQFQNGRIHPRGMLGKTAWNKGKENPYWKGKNNPNWNGGSSFEEYGQEFNNALKNKIRKRDDCRCQECKNKIGEMVIHHIDYNKKNNQENNLITLCRSCHSKTNFNRKDWKKYFMNYDICRTPAINKTGEVEDKKPLR
jgi:hypothetical protein